MGKNAVLPRITEIDKTHRMNLEATNSWKAKKQLFSRGFCLVLFCVNASNVCFSDSRTNQ